MRLQAWITACNASPCAEGARPQTVPSSSALATVPPASSAATATATRHVFMSDPPATLRHEPEFLRIRRFPTDTAESQRLHLQYLPNLAAADCDECHTQALQPDAS